MVSRLVISAPVGAEPPIDARGDRHGPEGRRRVSLRWLAGTGLTGLIGAGLLGGAIYAAFDREANFAEAPTRALLARRENVEGAGVNPLKGDRIVKAVDIVAARQTFKTPTTVRVGDKEVIRNRAFTRVSTTLALADTGLGADVPAFNPLKLLAESRNPSSAATDAADAADSAPPQDDAEVSFTSSDLATVAFSTQGPSLSLDEVRAQVAETVKNALANGAKAPLPLPPQLLLMRTSRAALDTPGSGLAYATPGVSNSSSPFSTIEVRMVPENVTLAPRTTTPADGARPSGVTDQLALVKHGEGLDDVLAGAGVSRTTAASIKAAFRAKGLADPAVEGRRIKLSFAEPLSGDALQLARLSVYDGDTLLAVAALADDGRFMLLDTTAAPERKVKKPADDESDDGEDDAGAMRLYNSLYETALKQDIPRGIIDQMVRTFGNDVDFQRAVTPGDSIDAFFDNGEEAESNHADLLYAAITTRGETYRYYRFQSPDDQSVDYYDPSGRSTRKFLLRKPIASGELRSGFGMRYHPILHYTRPHNGVDWAAPIGTPIFAAGNGEVIKAGWSSGYGRRVEIEHANGYVTTYNHMSAFGRGIKEGMRINQGQIVGYLGASGLATGPHLHYEVIVNGHYVDPMRVKLARTKQFDGKLMGDFKRERDRIDGLMAKAPNGTRVAGQ